jgi:hypothetical protein
MQKLSGTSSVVGYFTRNRTKLVLHFSDLSMIFYAIYKKQESNFTIRVILLRGGPWKETFFAMSPLGWPAGAGRSNSGELLAGAGLARAGVDLQTHMAPFRGSLGA